MREREKLLRLREREMEWRGKSVLCFSRLQRAFTSMQCFYKTSPKSFYIAAAFTVSFSFLIQLYSNCTLSVISLPIIINLFLPSISTSLFLKTTVRLSI